MQNRDVALSKSFLVVLTFPICCLRQILDVRIKSTTSLGLLQVFHQNMNVTIGATGEMHTWVIANI